MFFIKPQIKIINIDFQWGNQTDLRVDEIGISPR